MLTSCRSGAAVVVVLLAAVSVAVAASNLNLSKSNVDRLTYNADVLTEDQADAMLAALETAGPMDEEQLNLWLQGSFRRLGIDPNRVKKIVVLPAGTTTKERVIILLSNPADEKKAVKMTAKSGRSESTTVKSSKSNSSE